ncbi:hypothetical protein ACLKA7_007839 [Drosophila subpalustris]
MKHVHSVANMMESRAGTPGSENVMRFDDVLCIDDVIDCADCEPGMGLALITDEPASVHIEVGGPSDKKQWRTH